MSRHYELGNAVLRTDQPLTLWKADRGFVEVSKGTSAVAVTFDGRCKGYIFEGNGRMVLDTIVETEQGAVGRPVERTLAEPFLMLGNPQRVESHLTSAPDGEHRDFLTKAGDLFDQFSSERRGFNPGCCGHVDGELIFAFRNASDRLDLLVLNGPRMVYRAGRMMFMSDGSRAVIKSPEQMVMSNGGRCLVIKGRHQTRLA